MVCYKTSTCATPTSFWSATWNGDHLRHFTTTMHWTDTMTFHQTMTASDGSRDARLCHCRSALSVQTRHRQRTGQSVSSSDWFPGQMRSGFSKTESPGGRIESHKDRRQCPQGCVEWQKGQGCIENEDSGRYKTDGMQAPVSVGRQAADTALAAAVSTGY